MILMNKLAVNNFNKTIRKGDFVKVSNFKERFWIEVIDNNNDEIIGRIDNYLIDNKNYDYNSIVLFNKINVLDYCKKYN